MKKLVSILCLVAVLGSLLSACAHPVPTATPVPPTKPAPTQPPPTAVPQPTTAPVQQLGSVLKIGQISMLSGVMALYGQQQTRGFALGLEYASGGKKDDKGRYIIANRPVEVLTRDDEGNAEKGVQLARELIEKEKDRARGLCPQEKPSADGAPRTECLHDGPHAGLVVQPWRKGGPRNRVAQYGENNWQAAHKIGSLRETGGRHGTFQT